MIVKDDRTKEQKLTHQWAVIGTDRILSHWGKAFGGMSYAGWAFDRSGKHGKRTQDECLEWVKSRTDMQRVRLVYLPTYRPTAAHTHIYLWDEV